MSVIRNPVCRDATGIRVAFFMVLLLLAYQVFGIQATCAKNHLLSDPKTVLFDCLLLQGPCRFHIMQKMEGWPLKHKIEIIAITLLMIIIVAAGARSEERFEPAIETGFSKLGARFYINPQPQKLSWKQSPLGTFMDTVESFFAGAVVEDSVAALPFQNELPQLESVETAVTMTSGVYRGVHPAGVTVEMKIVAPFYPRDVKLSDAPYFYIDLTVRNTSGVQKSGTLFLGQTFALDQKIRTGRIGESPALRADGGYSVMPNRAMELIEHPEKYPKTKTTMAFVVTEPPDGLKAFKKSFVPKIMPGAREKTARRSAGFTAPFELSPGGVATVRLILAAYSGEDILFRNDGVKYAFKYTSIFPDIESVVEYAAESREHVLKKTGEFDALIEDSSLSDSYKIFLSIAFQSWMLNTWWAVSDGGDEWFSEMEGYCRYQSTIDVSYNTALIYYELWPELLKMQFDEWEFFAQDKKLIMHDLGSLQTLSGTEYSMPVEENANYLLMLHHYIAVTGDRSVFLKRKQLVHNLAKFIADADTNGDGFPEEGTYNTYERKLPNPLGAEGVVYVAVKAYAAMQAAGELALESGDDELVKLCREYSGKFKKTFDARAWRGDHYSVCLQETVRPGTADIDRGLPHPAYPGGGKAYVETLARVTGEDGRATNRDEVPLKHFDAYTILTSNGLFYLMRSGTPYGLDDDRVTDDLVNSSKMTWREYGNPQMGDPDDRGMWLSANVWRDMTAAYAGLDWSGNFDAYRPAVNMRKRHNEGVYADSFFYDMNPEWEWDLTYYPRGITAIGVPSALAGMSVDAEKKTLRFRPVRADLKVPLFMFADWENGVVPWITTVETDGEIKTSISDRQLLDEWEIVTGE